MSEDLSKYAKNVYSQFGEDGVIAEVLYRISRGADIDKWCVEFGAWDGVHLSNTCRLIREEGYNAVLIEGATKRFDELNINLPQDNVYKICRFVNFEGNDTLENILAETPIPRDFDFLSIDVDGVDYYILDGLKKFTPKVVCIEFNPSIPNAVDFVQPKDFSIKQGASAKAISRLAVNKGYALVATTWCNLIFVRDDLVDLVVPSPLRLEDLNVKGNDPQYIFVGYDGTILSNKPEVRLIWHDISVPMSSIQFLPRALRVFGGDYSLYRKLAYHFYVFLKLPSKVMRHFLKRLHD
ncbi:MAG: hypothetical protein JSW45_09260 [Thiotrichales bacterium]|nr:MAG: hypothetical protein JSW45_09260 [Thiotrichales bacterium]